MLLLHFFALHNWGPAFDECLSSSRNRTLFWPVHKGRTTLMATVLLLHCSSLSSYPAGSELLAIQPSGRSITASGCNVPRKHGNCAELSEHGRPRPQSARTRKVVAWVTHRGSPLIQLSRLISSLSSQKLSLFCGPNVTSEVAYTELTKMGSLFHEPLRHTGNWRWASLCVPNFPKRYGD